MKIENRLMINLPVTNILLLSIKTFTFFAIIPAIRINRSVKRS